MLGLRAEHDDIGGAGRYWMEFAAMMGTVTDCIAV